MRCPVCRADNNQPPQCRRCKADLSLLFTLEGQRQDALASAARCLARAKLRRALALAEGAAALRREDDARRLLALLHLLRREFAEAWRYYASAAPRPAS